MRTITILVHGLEVVTERLDQQLASSFTFYLIEF